MPRQELNPQLAKLAALQALAPAPVDNTGDMVAMLAHLYGIQQDQQSGPLKDAAIAAETKYKNAAAGEIGAGQDATALYHRLAALNVAYPEGPASPEFVKARNKIMVDAKLADPLVPEIKPQGEYGPGTAPVPPRPITDLGPYANDPEFQALLPALQKKVAETPAAIDPEVLAANIARSRALLRTRALAGVIPAPVPLTNFGDIYKFGKQ